MAKDRKDNSLFEALCANGLIVLEEERTIYINGPITSTMSAFFNLALLKMEHTEPGRDITVYINSPGGEVTAGLSMIDTMDTISCDICTVCVGQAASMGAVILMCGTKGKRKILPHSCVLIHQILAGLGDGLKQASDIEIFASNVTRRKKDMTELIAFRTGQSVEKVGKDCERDYSLSGTEAVEYGIVDAVVGDHKEK